MDDDDFEYETFSAPLTWQAVGAITFAGVSGVVEQVAGIFEGLSTAFAADHNWQMSRRQMHEEAALEIEALVRGVGE